MKKGLIAAMTVASVVLITTCAKPKLNGVADGVIFTMNDVSSNMSKSINGGFSEEEIFNCEKQNTNIQRLRLGTGAVVNIFIMSGNFSLYTEEHSISDFDEPTMYTIDSKKNLFTYYTRNWKGAWDQGTEIEIFHVNSDTKKTINIANPFQIARRRLGVRMGMKPSLFNGVDPSLLLSQKESEAVFCASALNTQYELLLKRAYNFKD